MRHNIFVFIYFDRIHVRSSSWLSSGSSSQMGTIMTRVLFIYCFDLSIKEQIATYVGDHIPKTFASSMFCSLHINILKSSAVLKKCRLRITSQMNSIHQCLVHLCREYPQQILDTHRRSPIGWLGHWFPINITFIYCSPYKKECVVENEPLTARLVHEVHAVSVPL